MPKKSEGRRRRLTPAEWAEAEELYELGGSTVEELATKFGISPRAMRDHFSKEEIEKGAKAEDHAREVKEKVRETSMDSAAVIAQRIAETKEKHFRYSEMLEKLAMGELIRATKDGVSLETVSGSMKALKTASEILRNTRDARYKVLGLDDMIGGDGELPDLVVRELTEPELEEIRNRQLGDPLQLELEDAGLDDAEDVVIEE